MDQMQSSDTAKDVMAKMNGSLGIKSQLGSDTDYTGSMKEKTKTSWEHFYIRIYYRQARKNMWHSEGSLLLGVSRDSKKCEVRQ